MGSWFPGLVGAFSLHSMGSRRLVHTAMASIAITTAQRRFLSWSSDVLVYIVVLNFFVEFNDAIIIDSFWISILTAVLLTALLDIIVGLEHRVGAFFEQRGEAAARVRGFVSRFAILEVVDFLFGKDVELGHFIDVLILIIAMVGTTAALDKIYDKLGND